MSLGYASAKKPADELQASLGDRQPRRYTEKLEEKELLP
jgi:hypothetical protein